MTIIMSISLSWINSPDRSIVTRLMLPVKRNSSVHSSQNCLVGRQPELVAGEEVVQEVEPLILDKLVAALIHLYSVCASIRPLRTAATRAA